MKRNNKQVTTYFILLALLLIGVIYAILQANLQINGTAKIGANTWDIHFDNIQVNENSVSIGSGDSAATIDPENDCKVDFEVTLSLPGDFYEFTVDVVNAGTIDGMIQTYTIPNVPNYLDYTITYADGMSLAENQLLSAGATETYKARLEFRNDLDELPDAETLSTSFEVVYVQADESAEVVHGLTGTKYRTLPYKVVWLGDNVSEGVTLFDSVTEAKNAFNNIPFYLKHEIENDIVKDSYVCFEKDSNTYCLRGQQTYENTTGSWKCKSEFYDSVNEKCISTYYESNKTILKNAFGESNCTQYSSDLYCSAGGMDAGAYERGGVYVDGGTSGCNVDFYGDSCCNEW